MSLKLIDDILERWKEPDYSGLDNPIEIREYNRNILINIKITKDLEEMKYIKSSMKPFEEYGSELKDMMEYFNDYNFVFDDPNKPQQEAYKIPANFLNYNIIENYIKKSTKNILEIGFDSGVNAFLMLSNINANLTSIDYFDKVYSWYGKAFIDLKFPGRHSLLIGLPNDVLQLLYFGYDNTKMKQDIILFNGSDHNLYENILILRKYSHDETILIVNYLCPHTPVGLKTYLIINKLIKEGVIKLVEHIKVDKKYTNGIGILQYNMDEPIIPPAKIYREIEKDLPLTEFKYFLYNRKEDKYADNTIIKQYAKKLISAGVNFDDDLIEYIKDKFNINI